jgi:hypothetical protein
MLWQTIRAAGKLHSSHWQAAQQPMTLTAVKPVCCCTCAHEALGKPLKLGLIQGTVMVVIKGLEGSLPAACRCTAAADYKQNARAQCW